MNWISEIGGVPTKAAYGDNQWAYTSLYGTTDSGNTGKPSSCKSVMTKVGGVAVGFGNMVGTELHTSESAMLSHICNKGPITLGVSGLALHSYQAGTVLTSRSCNGDVTHAVQLVGVSEDGNYWIVRNSWGADWGNAGYFYMKYGENTCNIQSAGKGNAYASKVGPAPCPQCTCSHPVWWPFSGCDVSCGAKCSGASPGQACCRV